MNRPRGTGTGESDGARKMPRPPIQWRLRQVMEERGVPSATELQRMLARAGVQISRQQLSRIVAEMPRRLPVELLAGLAHVLRCGHAELVRVGVDLDAQVGIEIRSSQSICLPPVASVRGRRRSCRGPADNNANKAGTPSVLTGGWVDRLLALPLRPYGSTSSDGLCDQRRECP